MKKAIIAFLCCVVFIPTLGSLQGQIITSQTNDIQVSTSVATSTSGLKTGDDEEDELDLAAKFAAMEKELAELKKSTEERFKKDEKTLEGVADKVPSFLVMGHGDETMKFSGRIHSDYWAFPDVHPGINPLEGGDPQDRFAFRRLRFGVSGKIEDNMLYKIEMEFAGGNNVEFRDAYIGVENHPLFHTILIGNQKRPYGLDHLNSSRYNVFLERPFVIESFNQDARRFGMTSNGVSDDQKWNWRYGVYNMRLVQALGQYRGDHYQLEGAARMANTIWYDETSGGRGYAHWAVSGAMRFPDGFGGNNNESRFRHRPEARSNSRWLDTGRIVGADQENIIGLESVLNVGAFQFVSEFMGAEVERSPGFGDNVQLYGGYAYVSYFLTGEHMPWNRKTGCLGRIKPFENFFSVRDCDGCIQRGMGAWQVAARYSFADFTDSNIIGGDTESLTLGLNWYWNPYTRWQFNYIVGDIDRQAAGGGDYQIFGARFMVDF